MWLCKRKLDEQKSNDASLALQHMVHGPAFLHRMLKLVKGTSKPNICCDLPYSLIHQGGLLLVVSHLFAVPLSFMGGVGKK
jgi:hypothetical protein